jgi:Phosphate-induced protein 1 conserved region/Divergent InlB B-repeat domain
MATFAIAVARGAGFAAARDVLNAARMTSKILPLLLLAACAPATDLTHVDAVSAREALAPAVYGNGINYYGGPVHSAPNVYLLWYGNFTNSPTPPVLTDFVSHLGGSPYWGIISTYTDGNGQPLANALHYGGALYDNYSHGTAVPVYTDRESILTRALTVDGGFPVDANGIYVIITSNDVNIGTPSGVCAWHDWMSYYGIELTYAVIPAPAAGGDCAYGLLTPNDQVTDSMVSFVAHEVAEATTDPYWNNGWIDPRPLDQGGGECADKCVGQNGAGYPTANGGVGNLHLGSHDYLVQENWVNRSLGYCAMQVENRNILTVTTSAGGSVYGAVSCGAGSTCRQSYDTGQFVALGASPASGFAFTGWSGCDSLQNGNCLVTLSADRTVNASFRSTAPPCKPKVDSACVSACMADCFGQGLKGGCKTACTAECTYGCGAGGL